MTHFFELDAGDQAALINQAARETGLGPVALEKDLWVCWALQALFDCPEDWPAMVFKGGTSLSKVYQAIGRFSEDIDVTVSHSDLGVPFTIGETTRSQFNKKLRPAIDDALEAHITKRVVPHLEKAAEAAELGDRLRITAASPGEGKPVDQIHIEYETVLDDRVPFIPPRVLIEFGSKNRMEPSQPADITPYISTVAAERDIAVPIATGINTLSGERTFWEKATLVHSEHHGDKLASRAERMSRHWYDLVMMSQHEVGERAKENLDLLIDVARTKKLCFYAGWAKYDEAEKGLLRLVPTEEQTKVLSRDYAEMKAAGFFFEEPPPFEAILEALAALQDAVSEGLNEP